MVRPGHEAAGTAGVAGDTPAPSLPPARGSTPRPGTTTLAELHALVARRERGVARIELANAIGLLVKRSQFRTVAEVCRATDDELLRTRGLTVRLLGRLRAYVEKECLC